MIKPCKIILKELQRISCHTDNILSFALDAPCIRCAVTGKSFDYSASEYEPQMDVLIDALADSGHIAYSDTQHYHFYLTARGLYPRLFKWGDAKSFIFGRS